MWIAYLASIALLLIIVGLLLAPVCGVRLTQRLTAPLLAASLLLIISLVMANALPVVGNDQEMIASLRVFSSIFFGLGILVIVFAAARFATDDFGETRTPPE